MCSDNMAAVGSHSLAFVLNLKIKVKKLKVLSTSLKHIEGEEVKLHSFLTSAIDESY